MGMESNAFPGNGSTTLEGKEIDDELNSGRAGVNSFSKLGISTERTLQENSSAEHPNEARWVTSPFFHEVIVIS